MTKKYSHHLVSEVFYWVGVLRTRSPGDSITVALRKPLQGGGRGSQAVYKFATKGVGGLHSKDQISVKELRILCKGRCTLSFQMHLGCLGPIQFPWSRLFLHSPSSSASTWSVTAYTGSQFGKAYSHLEARNHRWWWHFLFIDMAEDPCISQHQPVFNPFLLHS